MENKNEQLNYTTITNNIDDYVNIYKPAHTETFWFVNPWGGNVGYTKWIGTDCDMGYFLMGNCYKTKAEAEFARDRQILITEIKRYIIENDPEPLDWTNIAQLKCQLHYDYTNNTVSALYTFSSKVSDKLYFSNKLDWQAMVKDIGEVRIKKYLFGVE